MRPRPPVSHCRMVSLSCACGAASAFGEDAYGTLELKAAAMFKFLGGESRVARWEHETLLVPDLGFLRLNGFRVAMSNDDAFDLILDVAQGTLELNEVAGVLADHLVAVQQ